MLIWALTSKFYYEFIKNKAPQPQNHKRNLSIDLSMSTISGSGVVSVTAYNTVTIVVTAKDSSGTPIGVGGETLIAEVHNEWTLDADYYWTEVASARQVLSSPLVGTMTDNADGTYSYTYSVTLDGIVTVFVYKESHITGVFYNSATLTGTTNTIELNDLQNAIAASNFPHNSVIAASAEYFFTLVAPDSNTYTFTANYNDAFNMTLGIFAFSC